MPCIPINREVLTVPKRKAIDEALRRLERALSTGQVTVKIGPQGAAVLVGWQAQDREGLGDVCAIRALTSEGSFALRKALATAEAHAGRKLDMRAVNAGVHSHDGGATWGRG